MTEQARETVLCAECERRWERGHECDDDPLTEQARETPEPLTQQPDVIRNAVRTLGPAGTLAEGIVQQAALAHADRLDALRAATPDPAEPGLREALLDDVAGLSRFATNTGDYVDVESVMDIIHMRVPALSDTTEGQS
jgi:hypothetical protein